MSTSASFTTLVSAHSDLLVSLGYALETVGNLLGADGEEHNLSQADYIGLAHATRAMAGYAMSAGIDLLHAADRESQATPT